MLFTEPWELELVLYVTTEEFIAVKPGEVEDPRVGPRSSWVSSAGRGLARAGGSASCRSGGCCRQDPDSSGLQCSFSSLFYCFLFCDTLLLGFVK